MGAFTATLQRAFIALVVEGPNQNNFDPRNTQPIIILVPEAELNLEHENSQHGGPNISIVRLSQRVQTVNISRRHCYVRMTSRKQQNLSDFWQNDDVERESLQLVSAEPAQCTRNSLRL